MPILWQSLPSYQTIPVPPGWCDPTCSLGVVIGSVLAVQAASIPRSAQPV